MATVGSNTLTLADWAKRVDPTGKTSKIVEILNQTNDILIDMLWKEGNLPTGMQATIRTGLPAVYWRMLNQGVPSSKSTTAQVTEQCGLMEAWAECDVKVAKMNGNVKEFRLSEAKPFMEAMNQEMAGTSIYGSTANPEEFVGLANRYVSTSDANGENIMLAGGAGSDNTSIWLVGWGENSIHGIFPKGSKAGLDHKDLGEVTIETTTGIGGSRMRAYQDQFTWDAGLMVKDWRYGVRIANVDISDLIALTGTQAVTASTSILKLMSRSIDRLPTLSGVKPVFYASRTVLSHMRVAAMDKTNNVLSVTEGLNQFGDTIHNVKFLGIPVRLVDQLSEAETAIS